MIKTNIYFLLTVILITSISSCHKDEVVESKYLRGDWNLEQLLINGIDTTPFLKKDSNCFGFTRFVIIDRQFRMKNLPVYNDHALTFTCFTDGFYFYPYNGSYNNLEMEWGSGTTHCGPYLADTALVWNVDVLNESEMKLSITFEGLPCTATYQRP